MKKKIGFLMLLLLFLGIFIFMVYDFSLLIACRVVTIVSTLVVFMYIAIGLIMEED